MNPMDFDRSLVRQRNEELLREVSAQRLETRLRAARGEVGQLSFSKRKVLLSMRRIALVFVLAAMIAASIVFSASAFAMHPHYLLTPGTCVEDVAQGQTSNGEGEGGFHKFHDHVHKGQPGMAAFQNENNPVHLDKESCPTE